MKHQILFVAIIISMTSFQARAQSQSAESLLTHDLLASVKTLQQEVHVYNYFNIPEVYSELETNEGRKSFVQRYLSYRAGSFWDLNFTDASPKNYASGPGLYFAIDPLISQKYGNSFIQMTLPAGTRFVNVVKPIPLKKETIAALIREGFLTTSQVNEVFPKQMGFYRDTLRVMVLSQYTAFRNLVKEIFTQMNIQFIEYNFNTTLMGFCAKHSYSAFVFVGAQNNQDAKWAIIDKSFSNISMHSNQFNLPNLTEDEFKQKNSIEKFANTLAGVAQLITKGRTAIKNYILMQYTSDELKTIKQETFSCE